MSFQPKDERRPVYYYELKTHPIFINLFDKQYCRMANALISGSHLSCNKCPLWKKYESSVDFQITPDTVQRTSHGAKSEYGECVYYDIESSENILPVNEKIRIDGLILAGITADFPDYVDNDTCMPGEEIYERAIQFAASAYKCVKRLYFGQPYITRAVEVSSVVKDILLSEKGKLSKTDYQIMAAAVLYEVLEKTDTVQSDIVRHFGKTVTDMVTYEKEDMCEEVPIEQRWIARTCMLCDYLDDAPKEIKLLFFADKLTEIRDLHEYCEKGFGRYSFEYPDVREQLEDYYMAATGKFECFENTKEYTEYMDKVNEIFRQRMK